ncbi:MAG: isocitrate/isopropylmalate dehydrogenase family protein [Acidilobaceae archaeon]
MPRLVVIEGDGIGPEVSRAALRVLREALTLWGIDLEVVFVEAGDSAMAKYGDPLPPASWRMLEKADVIVKGPVGESAGDVVVRIRRGLDLYANIRPARCIVKSLCLKDIDLVIVRENTEDVYVRAEYLLPGDVAVALKVTSRRASERIARVALELARGRRKHVTIVHKANVLPVTDGLFRDTARTVARFYPDVSIDEAYVDAAVMDIVRRPERFDVILTTNLYGDILSDLAAYVSGSIGIAPSANLGDSKAMFEPVHGAAFDIAGRNVANPTAMILCFAWSLRWLGEKYRNATFANAGSSIEHAVESVLAERRVLTQDLGGSATTSEFAEAVASKLAQA